MQFKFDAIRQVNFSKIKLDDASLEKLSKRVTVVLLLLLAWSLGSVIWAVVENDPSVLPAATTKVTVSNNNASAPSYQLNQLISDNLFGLYTPNASAAPIAAPIEAPKTKLNLQLVGLVESSVPSLGLAVIARNGKQQIYGIGETLEGTGVTLRQVLNDHVVLNNAGRDEILVLEGVDYRAQAQGSIVNRTTNLASSSSSSVYIADIDKIKAEIVKQPQALLKYITLAQERDSNGQVIGYRIGPGQDRTFFDEIGLQPEDVATSINGLDLADPASLNRIWISLANAPELTMSVLRNGQPQNIYVSLQ